jgi:Ran GTPase-activating protein (RanGAP) involved in mRNA processing and transport
MCPLSCFLHKQEVHRFSVAEVSWETLREDIRSLMANVDAMIVKYRDEAGDAVAITSQRAWEECLRAASSMGQTPLCLTAELVSARIQSTSDASGCDVISCSAAGNPFAPPTPMSATEYRVAQWERSTAEEAVAAEGEEGPAPGSPTESLPLVDNWDMLLPQATESAPANKVTSWQSAIHPKEVNDVEGLKKLLAESDRRAAEKQLVADILLGGSEKWRKTLAQLITSCSSAFQLSGHCIGLEGAKVLAEAIKLSERLSHIILSGNGIGSQGAQIFAEALKANHTVRTINLRYNCIGSEGAEALAVALATNTTVVAVDLTYNGIGDNGAGAIAVLLKINKVLRAVNLGGNNIGSYEAQLLAFALETNQSVRTIYLHDNSEIGTKGATALAAALKVNRTIRAMFLRNNAIGADGAKAFASALETSTTLRSLNLERNAIGNSGFAALAVALILNTSLVDIHLHGNQISRNVGELLADAVRAKRDVRFVF